MVLHNTALKYKKNNKYTLDWGSSNNEEIEFLDKSNEEVLVQVSSKLLKVNRVLPSMVEMLDRICADNSLQHDPNNKNQIWNVVGAKEIAREHQQTYEETSKYFLPVNLPLFVSEINTPSTTTVVIPVTITIKQSKEGIHDLKNARLLVAMVKILQTTFQDTNIGPVKRLHTQMDISSSTSTSRHQRNSKLHAGASSRIQQ
jgi:hypothetical protein